MTISALFERYVRRAASPAHLQLAAHTPLERLPMVAIDCETTGLDPRRDRIVSIATIRIDSGLHVAEQPLLDALVNPGVAIPARATAVHGIDDTQVAGAPSFAEIFDAIVASLHGAVAIGHHVAFDLAMIGREAARARLPWREPPSFDTALLSAGLGHNPGHADLIDLLGRLGIEPRGHRHTAAGDARMAADLFVGLAHRLIGHGRGTYGGAVAAHRAPRP